MSGFRSLPIIFIELSVCSDLEIEGSILGCDGLSFICRLASSDSFFRESIPNTSSFLPYMKVEFFPFRKSFW